MIKNTWKPLTIMVFIAIIAIGLITSPESLALFLSNSYFTISAVLLIIGLFGLVLKDGTFNLFHYSMKKAKDRIFNRKDTLQNDKSDQPKEDDLHSLSRSISNTYTYFIKSGLFFLASSIIFLIIYYIFNK